MYNTILRIMMLVALIALVAKPALAANTDDLVSRIEALEKKLTMLTAELNEAKANIGSSESSDASSGPADNPDTFDRFSFGGYGEIHANFTEGGSGDIFDIHRVVFDVGYEFSDWIRLDSEFELEHAYATDGAGGELLIEQLFIDFMLHEMANVRMGRILAPLGIVNQRHEPPSFNGVERPNFAKYMIPSTWSLDGVGLHGRIAPYLKYQAYVSAGLDGTKFSAKDGIRNGRMKERPSLNDPAYTFRLDYYPLLMSDVAVASDLRFGASVYHGGIDNANKGKDPSIDGSVTLCSGDFEVSLYDLDLRGALAWTYIDGASMLTGVAEEMFGYYVEAGYHILPDSLKTGKLENSDVVVFVRYDDYDTQYRMPAGVAANPAGDRNEITFGVNVYPTPNLVLKADYQVMDDATTAGRNNMINFGVGWQL
jgi:hypothetical protein